MGQLVKAQGISLGDTPAGSAWCMKALNPASGSPHVGRPDGSSLPVIPMHFEQSILVAAPAAAVWTLDYVMSSNPHTFGCVYRSDGVATGWTSVLNLQLGASSALIKQALYEQVEQYRLSYASVSAELVATSTTDSGTINAAQYIYEPVTVSYDTTAAAPAAQFVRLFDLWQDTPKSFASLVQCPGVFTGEAREGCYMPMKMDDNTKWRRTNDLRGHLVNVDYAGTMTHAHTYVAAGAGAGPYWPFGFTGWTDASKYMAFRNCQRTTAHLAIQGLAPTATVKLTIRYGFEFAVPPNTNYSMMATLPPVFDERALVGYQMIARRMKDAYPLAFNDWQKIVKTIGDIARTVLPSIAPALTPLIRPIETIAIEGGNLIGRATQRIRDRREARRRLAVRPLPPIPRRAPPLPKRK